MSKSSVTTRRSEILSSPNIPTVALSLVAVAVAVAGGSHKTRRNWCLVRVVSTISCIYRLLLVVWRSSVGAAKSHTVKHLSFSS